MANSALKPRTSLPPAPSTIYVVGGAIPSMKPVEPLPTDDTLSADCVAKRPLKPNDDLPTISTPIRAADPLQPCALVREPSLIGEDGHRNCETQVDAADFPVNPSLSNAETAIDPLQPYTLMPSAYAQTINAIRELHRQRNDLMRAEGNLTRQLKAMCRRAAGVTPDDPPDVKRKRMAQAAAMYASFRKGVGQGSTEAHRSDADDPSAPLSDDDGQVSCETQPVSADSSETICAESEGQCLVGTLSGRAITLSAIPIVMAERLVGAEKRKVERMMAAQAKMLPIHSRFVEQINGFGTIGLAQIIGEAGDLLNYANPGKLWKRMGLALVGGERQRKCTDAAKALAHGYSPQRRSTMYVIGDSLLKKQSPYKELYDARKVFEIAKAEAAGKQVVPAAKIPAAKSEQFMSQGHVHRRSQRYTEKRLLRDLWIAWRDCMR